MGISVKARQACSVLREHVCFFITTFPEPVPEGSTSLHPAFRSAFFHAMASIDDPTALKSWLSFGNSSYFAESTFNIDHWQERYWGENYARLLDVKNQVDPNGVFWCHHCVGWKEDPPTPTPSPSPTPPSP